MSLQVPLSAHVLCYKKIKRNTGGLCSVTDCISIHLVPKFKHDLYAHATIYIPMAMAIW